MADKSQTITLDGIAYDLEQFSEGVKQAVGIYNAINADLQKSQLEVVKCQSAMQSIGMQISAAVKKELDEKTAALQAPAEVAADAPVADAPVTDPAA